MTIYLNKRDLIHIAVVMDDIPSTVQSCDIYVGGEGETVKVVRDEDTSELVLIWGESEKAVNPVFPTCPHPPTIAPADYWRIPSGPYVVTNTSD